ncbi:MAG: membrane protein insertase YidC [Dysgonamonadaceae bacterium]|jgi:YidC/Oxa1 family membrane protein insertase|nr:membrane protein insertase YidC [Dysgonamonadaceae bacterium]
MDRNTIIGLVLMLLIIVGFSWLNRPSQEQIEAQQKYRDSIATVQAKQQAEYEAAAIEIQKQEKLELDSIDSTNPDSLRSVKLQNEFGVFASVAEGQDEIVTLENEVLEIKFSTKGGQVRAVRLKDHTTYEDKPLVLFEEENESQFGVTLITADNRVINTENMYFEPEKTANQVIMRLKTNDGASLDFVYSLAPGDYILQFNIIPNGLDKHLIAGTNALDLRWVQYLRRQEKGRSFEGRYARLTSKYFADDDVEELKEAGDDSRKISNKLKWIAYKDQFFSSVLISDDGFEANELESKVLKDEAYLKLYTTNTRIAFDPKGSEKTGLYYYFGPNQYSMLKDYDKTHFEGRDLQLERLVPLGWSLFRYVNKWIVIPLFDFWAGICANVGLAILLLTVTIKLLLSPFTYKSYKSSAKMRVMRPQVEEINRKYPGQDNAMTRQQKTMELYRQVGVSPMSGCLPMLLQMPFWIALFMFFPTSIELRGESFLWVSDLSTYDAVISWDTYVPLVTPYFGNHLSLFCLLMAITTIIYTKFNMDQTNTGQQQMPGMKLMMYAMPVFMFVWFNQYPAGLSYYYLCNNLITIAQTLGFRHFINEEKLLAQLEENKKKPAKKKSGFMARLEEAQRQQQALAKQKAQQQRKGTRR